MRLYRHRHRRRMSVHQAARRSLAIQAEKKRIIYNNRVRAQKPISQRWVNKTLPKVDALSTPQEASQFAKWWESEQTKVSKYGVPLYSPRTKRILGRHVRMAVKRTLALPSDGAARAAEEGRWTTPS